MRFEAVCVIISFVADEELVRKHKKINIGLSPNGKALDSDSSISRFESL